MIFSIWHLVYLAAIAAIVAHYFTSRWALREMRASMRQVQIGFAREHHEKYMDNAVFYWRKNRTDAIQWVIDAVDPSCRKVLCEELGESEYRTYLGSIYDRSKRRD